MIIVNNGVTNLRGTPACYTDFSFNRPLANAVTVGSLFFATDTNLIYQVHLVGSVPTWESMGGGGGGTQDLNDVLFQGGTFTNYRTSNLNSFGWELYNVEYFKLHNENNQKFWFTNTGYNYYNSANNNNLFSLTFGTGDFAMGDFTGEFNGTHMFLNVSSNRIYFAPGGVMSFLNEPGLCTLGDGFNLSNGTKFITDVSNQLIYSNFGVDNGIKLDNANFVFKFGDFEGLSSGYLQIDNSSITTRFGTDYIGLYADYNESVSIGYFNNQGSNMTFYHVDGSAGYLARSTMQNPYGINIYEIDSEDRAVKLGDYANVWNSTIIEINDYYNLFRWFNINSWEITGSITTTSASGNSGQHLKVTINGTDYVIELKNP